MVKLLLILKQPVYFTEKQNVYFLDLSISQAVTNYVLLVFLDKAATRLKLWNFKYFLMIKNLQFNKYFF